MKTDQQLQQDVMDELKWDPLLAASEIGVSVKNGVVTLSGYVNSFSKKYAAENAAKRVKGVQAVAEDIQVRLGFDGKRTDSEIAEMALNALKWDTEVPDSDLRLKVENGWINLEGSVEWQFQKDAAVKAVRNIVGVKGVTNTISVNPKINKAVVETKIKNALERSATVEAEGIKVETKGGKVILRGKVRSWAERRDAERAAWSSPGVKEVEDELSIMA